MRQANRPQGWLPAPESVNPLEMAEERVWWAEVHAALLEAISCLPQRLRQVIVAAYGLGGEPPRTLVAIGRCFGVTGEMARYWRNNGLVLLRLPAFSGRLRQLCDQDSRTAYLLRMQVALRPQALNRAWLRQRRGRRRR